MPNMAGASLKAYIIGYIMVVISLIAAIPMVAHAQFLTYMAAAVITHTNLNNMIFFTNTNFQIQDVFYKYEYFYVFINLTDVYPGQPVYLTLTISGPPGNGTLYQGIVYGGYLYYGEIEIVPPIYNGATYTISATACLIVNNVVTNFCASGSNSYIEEDHPPAKIVGVPYIINSNGKITDVLIGGYSYTLVVNVNDTGYIPYTYYIEVNDSDGLIAMQVIKVSAQALSNVTVDIPIDVAAPNTVVNDVVTISVYGDGYLDASYSMRVLVTPSRPGPFKLIAVNTTTLREGEEEVIEAILQNTGYTASDISASVSSTVSPNAYAVVSSSSVDEGDYLYVYIYITPNTAGSGVVKLSLTYGWPYTNTVYSDTFQFNVNVLTNITVAFASINGGQVNATAIINGQESNSLWVMPGEYTISVPSVIPVSSSVRYVFSHWSSGYGTSPTINVDVEGPLKLTAYYVEQYYVSVVDLVTGRSIIGWFNGGSTLTLPTLPQFISFNNGSRLMFQGWSCGYPASATITVNSPINCTAEWVKQYEVTLTKSITGPSGTRSEVVNSTWVTVGGSFTLPQEPQFIYMGNGTRLMFEGWFCNGVPQESLTIQAISQPLQCDEKWVEQYEVVLIKVVTGPLGSQSEVINSTWVTAGGSFTLPQEPQLVYVSNGTRLMFEGWLCNGIPQESLTIQAIGQPLQCSEKWITQYMVVVENKVIQLSGPPAVNVLSETWVNVSSGYGIYVYDYRPRGGNVMLPIVYKYALVITNNGVSKVYSPTINVGQVTGPVTIILVWAYSLLEVIGTSLGGVMVLGIVFRDKVKRATTLIVKRATTVVTRKETTKKPEVAEDGTRIYANDNNMELPVKPLDERTKVKRSDETVVRSSGEGQTKDNSEGKEDGGQ